MIKENLLTAAKALFFPTILWSENARTNNPVYFNEIKRDVLTVAFARACLAGMLVGFTEWILPGLAKEMAPLAVGFMVYYVGDTLLAGIYDNKDTYNRDINSAF